MKVSIRFDRIIVALITLVVFLTGMLSSAQIRTDQFEEVTTSAGISYQGTSYGMAWGDVNGDGWPDLWLGNHHAPPLLYLNNGDGTFTDITHIVRASSLSEDTHGPAWADFDRDGDEDLIELVGACGGFCSTRTFLFVNEYDAINGRTLTDRAEELGPIYPLGRGRTPLWLDFNGDGWLDVILNCASRNQAPTAIFQQVVTNDINTFEDVTQLVGLGPLPRSRYTLMSDLSGDGKLDLLFSEDSFPRTFDITSIPFRDIKCNWCNSNDVAPR